MYNCMQREGREPFSLKQSKTKKGMTVSNRCNWAQINKTHKNRAGFTFSFLLSIILIQKEKRIRIYEIV